MTKIFDYVIIGAGIYGLYAAKILANKGKEILVIECESKPFKRASYINQARVHNGYHYPRSFSTAIKSAKYYKRFCIEFADAIHDQFLKIYAISRSYSYTKGEQFERFCSLANIPCKKVLSDHFFNPNTVESAYETLEYSFDANIIQQVLCEELSNYPNCSFFYDSRIISSQIINEKYILTLNNGSVISTDNVLNATYTSINIINNLFDMDLFEIKYEIAEVIVCSVSPKLQNVGLTVMDGPFFSVMPFGLSGYHTITSVVFTPHATSYNELPMFACQQRNPQCNLDYLDNCNECSEKPKTAWEYMHQMSKKYLHPDFSINYKDSLYAIKPILITSEIDDSRPTMIKKFRDSPGYFAVLSGKINTIFDLEEVL